MVLTANQIASFFTVADQMAIPAATVAQLANEGIDNVDDLAEFDKDSIKQIAKNMRAGQNAFIFSAKAQKRLIVSCELVRYYISVSRPITDAAMQWNQVGKNFEIQWKALKQKKDEDDPETPKLSKGFGVMKWSESFWDILHRCIGARMAPLAYVICEEPAVPAAIPPLLANHPHSAEAGSIEAKLIARIDHNHVLYCDNNAKVYYKMEEATQNTAFAASIAPYQRTKNGRDAFLAIVSQYAGEDKWNEEIRRQDQILHNQRWKGQSNFSLEKHCALHRNAYVQMQAAAEHVPHQLPNEFTRVGY